MKIMEAASSKSEVQVLWLSAGRIPSCLVEVNLMFYLALHLIGEDYITESNLFASKPTNLHINVIQKHPERNIQNNV